MTRLKNLNILLAIAIIFSTGSVYSESYTTLNKHSYHVDFDNPQSQSEALDNIQKKIKNKTNDEELKIILFGNGRALSLDANALNNTKIQYENTDEAVQKKVSELNKKGVRLIICKNKKSSKRHYSTNPPSSTIEKELQSLESKGYNCN